MIPDKIYVEVRHPFDNEFTVLLGYENRGNSDDIEYIRKDLLLEWAKEQYREYANNPFYAGERDAYTQLIKKLNSL